MFHGFYNLTSSIICQNRNMNVVSNNMTNTTTPGYKKDTFMASSFREELLYRTGNKDKSNPALVGERTMARVAQETVTNFAAGTNDETGGVLDFALAGKGFFQIQTQDGPVYTRNGSFMIDDQGYLSLSGVGRVMGTNGPLQLNTDDIEVDGQGNIFLENGTLAGRISVVDFPDYDGLVKEDHGMFRSQAAGTPVNSEVMWKRLESSNVNPMEEMTTMMSGQRTLQSSAQILKMYDQLMGKIVTEIGRV